MPWPIRMFRQCCQWRMGTSSCNSWANSRGQKGNLENFININNKSEITTEKHYLPFIRYYLGLKKGGFYFHMLERNFGHDPSIDRPKQSKNTNLSPNLIGVSNMNSSTLLCYHIIRLQHLNPENHVLLQLSMTDPKSENSIELIRDWKYKTIGCQINSIKTKAVADDKITFYPLRLEFE